MTLAFWIGLAGCMPDGDVIDPDTLRAGTSGGVSGAAGGSVPIAGTNAAGSAAGSRATSGAAGSGSTAGSGGRSAAAGSGGAQSSPSTGAGGGGSPVASAGSGGAPAGAGGSSGGTAGRSGAGGASGSTAGSSAGMGGTGAGGTSGASGAAGGNDATFSDVYALLETSCNGCHGPGAGGLTTGDKDVAYMNLVDADSGSCRGKKRVEPGNPDASVLYLAIARTSADGCDPPDMPSGAPKWDAADIEKVKAWIEAGAPDN